MMYDTGIRLSPISLLTQGGRWRAGAMRSYSSDQLLWFTRGQGRLTVGGTARGFGAHNAVFIPAGTMYAFELGAQVFGTALFLGALSGPPFPERPVHLRIRDAQTQAELTGILDQLQREADGDRPGRERSIEAYAGLLSVWLERVMQQQEDDLAANSASRRLARRFSELVEKDFHTGRGVSYYAERLGVTSTHLTRVCKQTCGSTASEFLAERKFSEARRLLADTRKPVKQIAAELGFASPAYFTRAFQGRCGQSPRSFRTGH
jgi:AraC-like DNA-binding protein